MADSTYYEILGVAPTANSAEIKTAYRQLSAKVHPDQGGPTALFLQVQAAYETLSNPGRRASYDASVADAGSEGWADIPGEPDSGWVRVDDPPASDHADTAGGNDSTKWGAPANHGARAQGSGPWAAPSSDAPGSGPIAGHGQTPGARRDGPAVPAGRASSFFSSHPSGVVAAGGLLVVWLGATLGGGLAVLGLIVLIVGIVGLVGSRRAQTNDNLLQSGISAVDVMSGTQFEMFLEALFAGPGVSVWRSGGRGDFGADLVVDGPTGRTIVQAKRWSGVVGHAAIQEVVAARGHYQGNHAIVATNSHFSSHAQKLARSNQVELWDRERIVLEIAQVSGLPAPPAISRFGSELRAGAPLVFGFLIALFASLSSNGKRSRSRRRRR